MALLFFSSFLLGLWFLFILERTGEGEINCIKAGIINRVLSGYHSESLNRSINPSIDLSFVITCGAGLKSLNEWIAPIAEWIAGWMNASWGHVAWKRGNLGHVRHWLSGGQWGVKVHQLGKLNKWLDQKLALELEMNLLYLKGMLQAIIELWLGEVKVVMLMVNNGLFLLVIKLKCSHYHYIQF